MATASCGDVRRLVVPIYLPAFLATLAQKLVIAALPLYVKDDLQGDDAAIGAITSMQGFGAFTTAAFAGYAIAFVGDRCGMIMGAILACTAYFACLLVTMLPVMQDVSMTLLACACFGTGVGKSAFEVARNSYMASNVPKALRGRANGLIGGCARIASMLGPALGGIVVHNEYSGAFMAQTLIGAATVGLLVVGLPHSRSMPSPPPHKPHEVASVTDTSGLANGDLIASGSGATSNRSAHGSTTSDNYSTTSDGSTYSQQHNKAEVVASAGDGSRSDHRWRHCAGSSILVPLLAAGPTGFSFGFVRGARGLLIPLKADAIDLSASAVGYVTAASFACDSLLFPLGGCISDRYGRKAAGVPSLMIMAAGCVLLAFASGVWSVSLASALLGVGNALSSGIVQTVGQDAAPSDLRARSQFLGLYKVATDCGTFLGPLVVGLVSNAAGLDAAAEVIAAATGACALWYAIVSKESLRRPTISKHRRDADESSAAGLIAGGRARDDSECEGAGRQRM